MGAQPAVRDGRAMGISDVPPTPSDRHDYAFDRLYDTPDRPGLERGRDRQSARFDGDRVVERKRWGPGFLRLPRPDS
jgi:hypothetical protein